MQKGIRSSSLPARRNRRGAETHHHTFLLRQEQPHRQVSVKPHSSGQQPSGWTHRASPHRNPNCTSAQCSTRCHTTAVTQKSPLPSFACSKQAHSHREDFSTTINHNKGCPGQAASAPLLACHTAGTGLSHEDISSELSSHLEHPEGTLLSPQH